MVVLNSVVEFIYRCELINYNQFIETDHCSYVIDVNLELYFKLDHFDVDKVSSSQLNARRLSYREKFCKKIKEYIESTNLHNIIDQQCYIDASDEILEIID